MIATLFNGQWRTTSARKSRFARLSGRRAKQHALRLEPLEDRRLLAVILGQKWLDLDANGVKDEGEPGVNGWTINLLDAAGNLLDSTETAGTDPELGQYAFTDLGAGTYVIQEVLQPGWAPSTSDALADQAYALDQELGLFQEVGDLNNWLGEDENWMMAANVPDSNGNPAWYYILPNGGFYKWEEDTGLGDTSLEGELVDTFNATYWDNTSLLWNAPEAGGHVVTVGSSDTRTLDLGNYQLATLSGRKWHDLNADGVRDDGEPYLNGWTIELADEAGTVVDTTTTMGIDLDADGIIDPTTESGWYSFSDLALGVYRVREVLQDGWVPSAPQSPDHAVTLVSGDVAPDADFGNYQLLTLSGRKWHDLNADGVRDDGEPYLNDWTIELVDEAGTLVGTTTTTDMDLNEDGEIDPTTESGWYRFSDVVPGDYVIGEVVIDGWVQSAPDGGTHAVTLVSGDVAPGADFGNFQLASLIRGRTWHDVNGNGVRDVDDPFLNDWTIELTNEAGEVVATTTSADLDVDGDGNIDPETETGWYSFIDVVPGSYAVHEVQQGGWQQSAPPAPLGHAVVVINGTDVDDVSFGNTELTVDIIAVTPNPRASAVESITIVFSHAVNGFDMGDLSLSRYTDTRVDVPLNTATSALSVVDGGGQPDDEQTSVVYDARTGEILVNAPVSEELTSINIGSADSIFSGGPEMNLEGEFDLFGVDVIFKATFGFSFGSLSFGMVATPGLSEEFVVNDLTVDGSLAAGGGLGDVDLIYIPVPDSGEATLTTLDNITWSLDNLSRLTAEAGVYELVLDPTDSGIEDLFGSALLASDAEGWINGPGDANVNGEFNQYDIVQVLQIARFEQGPPAVWSEGDWIGDNEFNDADLESALEPGHYLQGPFTSVPSDGSVATDAVFEQIGSESAQA